MGDAAGQRVVIEGVEPQIEGGLFPIKRVVGERVVVLCDLFADGHDAVSARLLYRGPDDSEWKSAPMQSLGNDRWQGAFRVESCGTYLYTLEG